MAAAKIKKGDSVVVRSGKDKGRSGTVLQVLPKDGKVVVSGVNVAVRHRKPTQANPQGGIERREAPMAIAKVGLADPKTGKASMAQELYEETVARNVREQQADARPVIASIPASLAGYDTVLLGSPIWNVRPPLIMATFAGSFDFANKTVYPFVTYAVSGLGTAARDYAAWCPGATLGEGLAVRGEEWALDAAGDRRLLTQLPVRDRRWG